MIISEKVEKKETHEAGYEVYLQINFAVNQL